MCILQNSIWMFNMTKTEFTVAYKAFLSRHNLKPTDLMVGAGAGLMLYGLRDIITDIDCNVNEANYERFKSLGRLKYYDQSRPPSIEIGVFSLHLSDMTTPSELVNGIYTYTPKELLKQKLLLNRPKDQIDIAQLKHYISKNKLC